jgi:glycosyltransferase involved in cell wall biosynthesis
MLSNIIKALDKEKFEPVVVCPQGDGNEQLVAAGAEVLLAPRLIYQFSHYTGRSTFAFHPSFLKHIFMMWRDRNFWKKFISDIDADIVCLNAITLSPMAWAARVSGAKVLCLVQETTVRGMLGCRTAWLYHMLSKWMDAVMFISEHDRQKSQCKAPITCVIPNWISLNDYDRTFSRELARKQLDIPINASVVLMMGGIDKLKGTLPLIKAVAGLSDIEDLVVVIAGYSNPVNPSSLSFFQRLRLYFCQTFGFDYRKRVLKCIEINDLKNRVRFVGMQTDVARLYAATDVLVFPATRPHQARPVLEAGAMAKPAIVPDFPELAEFVENEFNGLTYAQGDVKSLESVLRKVLKDEVLAHRMGENNYVNTLENHNANTTGIKVNHLFKRLKEHYKLK